MNRRLPIFLATVVAALGAAGFAFQAAGQTDRPARFVVVVDTTSGPDPALVERAAAAVRRAERATGAEGELRVTRTPTEQLSVTHYFAAREYDTVVGVGLDEAIAVAPVAERFPGTRFSLTGLRGLAAAVAAAAPAQ
jgi:basic membrane lipoprotein Med (substrate-binding protein (PBP1-ABC) superfamily)